jgi:hypothetical protein
VFYFSPERRRPVGKSRKKFLDDVENYPKKMGVRGLDKTS